MSFAIMRRFGLINVLAFGYPENPQPSWYFVLALVLSAVIGYLLGSINFAIIISKLRHKEDIRDFGSGNAGMTNMGRTYGKSAAALTLIGDMLKGIVAVILAQCLMGEKAAYVAMLFAVIGHSFPVYYHFKGGKGVAVAAGMVLYLEPLVFAVLIVIFLIVLIGTKYVSLSSIMVMLIYPFLLFRMYFLAHGYLDAEKTIPMIPDLIVLVCAFAVSFIVIFMHRENISRLRKGTENKISLFKKKYEKEAEEARKNRGEEE